MQTGGRATQTKAMENLLCILPTYHLTTHRTSSFLLKKGEMQNLDTLKEANV